MIEHEIFTGNPAAFFVWSYALKNGGDGMSKTQLKTELGISERTWRRASSFLRARGLMAVTTVRSEDNLTLGRKLSFYSADKKNAPVDGSIGC